MPFEWIIDQWWILVVVLVIVISAVSSLFWASWIRNGGVSSKKCTEVTVGIIRSARQVGVFYGEDPMLHIELDAIGRDGSIFATSIKPFIPLTALAGVTEGAYVPIRFNPQMPTQAIFDRQPDPDQIQERVQRHQTIKHPRDLTFEQRMEIVYNGVDRKVRLEDVRLTGVVEAGEHEAVVVVQPAGPEFKEETLTRTMFLTDHMLESLTPGRYIDITVVPHQPELFSLNISVPFVAAVS